MNRALIIILANALVVGCAGGKAVRVDCEGPFTLINPVVAQQDGGAVRAPARTPRNAEARKP